jgi:hypothetical protein
MSWLGSEWSPHKRRIDEVEPAPAHGKKNMNTLEMAVWLARIGTRSILTLAVVALLFQGCAVSRGNAV